MATQRIYSTTDVGMLTAILTMIDSAIAAQEFLVTKRPLWKAPYFQDIRTRILNAFSGLLGVSNVAELGRLTKNLNELKASILTHLADFRIQLKADYADNPAREQQLLSLLGFTATGATALKDYKQSQEALVQLLQRIKTNITAEMKTELLAKGMSPQTLNGIIDNADTFVEANVKQERFKSEKKTLTDANRQELNALYTTVMGIGKIARSFYKGKPVEQEKFSFAAVLRNQGYRVQKAEKANPPAQPPA